MEALNVHVCEVIRPLEGRQFESALMWTVRISCPFTLLSMSLVSSCDVPVQWTRTRSFGPQRRIGLFLDHALNWKWTRESEARQSLFPLFLLSCARVSTDRTRESLNEDESRDQTDSRLFHNRPHLVLSRPQDGTFPESVRVPRDPHLPPGQCDDGAAAGQRLQRDRGNRTGTWLLPADISGTRTGINTQSVCPFLGSRLSQQLGLQRADETGPAGPRSSGEPAEWKTTGNTKGADVLPSVRVRPAVRWDGPSSALLCLNGTTQPWLTERSRLRQVCPWGDHRPAGDWRTSWTEPICPSCPSASCETESVLCSIIKCVVC